MSVIVRLGVPVLLSSPDVSNIFAGETDGMRIPMSVSFSGNLFSGNASASVTFFEPHALVGKLMPKDFGGLWTLTVNGIVSFIGYVANMRTQRTIGNGYIKAMNFSSICKAGMLRVLQRYCQQEQLKKLRLIRTRQKQH
jgi:hypothetical protein